MLSQRLAQLRTGAGITQTDLANILGVSKQSISNWENDNILPSIEMLEKIADYFGVSTDYLLGRDERCFLDTTGLNNKQIAHIRAIMQDITSKQ